MSALAQQQQMHFVPPQAQKQTTLFVGSISGGITDAFLNQLLTVSHFENSNMQRLISLLPGMRSDQVI